jgi:CHAD domain-containing protein
MAQTISLPIPAAKQDGLEKWMDRVLKRSQKVRKSWDADDIHNLRVALRRCRTMADALTDANPSPNWNRLKKSSKKAFHTLGELRDVQVEQEWVKRLAFSETEGRAHLLKQLRIFEKARLEDAQKDLDDFDRKEWRRLARKLRGRADIFPLGSVVFQRMALLKLNEAETLFQRARKAQSSIAWHRVRIAFKRFRYIAENFLPLHYEAWAADLKEMQDLLGDIHDLDVLRTYIRRHSREFAPELLAEWLEKIKAARAVRLEKFLAKANGKSPIWFEWRSKLQGGSTLRSATSGESREAYSAS